jgi:phosphoribosyl-AMP cyclohydrolase
MSKEYTDELLLDFGKDGQALIPVITQDYHTREVLILAFTNKEAFEETRKSGYATYFSRSRQEIWKKGETSGDFLQLKEIRINCEQNSLLYLVIPLGKGACHASRENGLPHTTCYYRRLVSGDKLEFTER